jgi:adenosylhomocysteine nucleosidase
MTSILHVMATTQECTPALAARITPLITGVGPIEAAASLAMTLAQFHKRPDLIVALGSCGSRELEHAQVYQVSAVRYRDMDCTAIGFERGVTPFSDHPAVMPLATVPGLPTATLSSGGAIVNGPAYDTIDAHMADMETYAFAHVARRFGVPLLCLRGVSDGRTPLGHIDDWTKTLEEIGHNLCVALDVVDAAIASGRLALATEPA